jgi:hypothetical protein
VRGPNITAPKPIPVGWEQLPVTEGIFKADKTKVKAPARAKSNFSSGLSFVIFTIDLTPKIKNGKNTNHQNAAQTGGKKPSMMCIP